MCSSYGDSTLQVLNSLERFLDTDLTVTKTLLLLLTSLLKISECAENKVNRSSRRKIVLMTSFHGILLTSAKILTTLKPTEKKQQNSRPSVAFD